MNYKINQMMFYVYINYFEKNNYPISWSSSYRNVGFKTDDLRRAYAFIDRYRVYK